MPFEFCELIFPEASCSGSCSIRSRMTFPRRTSSSAISSNFFLKAWIKPMEGELRFELVEASETQSRGTFQLDIDLNHVRDLPLEVFFVAVPARELLKTIVL